MSSISQRKRWRQPLALILFLCILLWSGILGWGLAQAKASSSNPGAVMAQTIQPGNSATVGTVDLVPQNLQLAQQIYLESCGACHIALPPAVMPTDTWRQLLLDPNHYGATLQLPTQPELSYVWNYLQTFSRPLNPDEAIPYRVQRSRYFKILHPQVELPQKISVSTCASCHSGAAQYDFRSLSPAWQNSP